MYEKKFQLENQVQKNNSKKTLKVTFSFGDNLLFAKLQCRRKTFICLHFNLKFYIKISKFTKTTSSKFDLSLQKTLCFLIKFVVKKVLEKGLLVPIILFIFQLLALIRKFNSCCFKRSGCFTLCFTAPANYLNFHFRTFFDCS